MTRYEITVDGTLGTLAVSALEGFEARPAPGGRTCLTGEVIDQAALQGAIHLLHDLQIEIIDLHRID